MQGGGVQRLRVWAVPIITIILFITLLATTSRRFAPVRETMFTRMRAQIDLRLRDVIAGHEHTLLSGILFGGGARFPVEWREAFRVTGTAHMVAVSGANIAFFVALLEVVLARMRLSPRDRLYAGIAITTTYIAMTGAPASVVRAGLMLLITRLAPLLGRLASPIHALTIAMMVMMIADPLIVHDIGFQFSCLATAGLLIAGATEGNFADSVRSTIAATLMILPLESFYFGSVSIVALLANALVAPLIPIIMVAGLVLVALLALPAVAHSVAWPLEQLLSLTLGIIRWCADIPGAALAIEVPLAAVVVWYAGLLGWVGYRIARSGHL